LHGAPCALDRLLGGSARVVGIALQRSARVVEDLFRLREIVPDLTRRFREPRGPLGGGIRHCRSQLPCEIRELLRALEAGRERLQQWLQDRAERSRGGAEPLLDLAAYILRPLGEGLHRLVESAGNGLLPFLEGLADRILGLLDDLLEPVVRLLLEGTQRVRPAPRRSERAAPGWLLAGARRRLELLRLLLRFLAEPPQTLCAGRSPIAELPAVLGAGLGKTNATPPRVHLEDEGKCGDAKEDSSA
jgi:hypothetical protein